MLMRDDLISKRPSRNQGEAKQSVFFFFFFSDRCDFDRNWMSAPQRCICVCALTHIHETSCTCYDIAHALVDLCPGID